MLEPPADAVAYAQETYGELMPFVRREWLLTNGIGGYAGGTVVGANTRRYHGLLIAATLPPVGRVATLARFGKTLRVLDGEVEAERHDLSLAYYRGDLSGGGDRMLRRFAVEAELAHWEYDAAGTKLYKDLLLCWEHNAVGVRYRLVRGAAHRGKALRLELVAFLAMRDHHGLQHTGTADLTQRDDADGRGTHVRTRDVALSLWADESAAGTFEGGPDWYYAHSYPMETARGLDDREDLYAPGTFVVELPADGGDEATITIWASLGDRRPLDWDAEHARRLARPISARPLPTATQRRLARSAADFVARRRPGGGGDAAPGTALVAGYPWLADRGRDAFVALPGLLLATGRFHEAGRVLAAYAHHVGEDGSIPDRFDGYSGEASYDSADAGLWFVEAAHAYLRASRDRDTYDSLLRPACEAACEGYANRTRLGVGVGDDGLIVVPDGGGGAMTWMDAREPDGRPAVDRSGRPVEVNALWYNALCHLGRQDEADRVRTSFVTAFWAGEGRGLHDVISDDGRPDGAMRPNQIFAVSLPHSPLNLDQQRIVVDAVRRELLTPLGLRTLGRGAAEYATRFTGPEHERARSAFNGTVWPWLIGPFVDAHLRINGRSGESLSRARTWLGPVLDHFEREGILGSVCEVFDAEWPHRPGGCFARAWGVAEMLRLAVELEL